MRIMLKTKAPSPKNPPGAEQPEHQMTPFETAALGEFVAARKTGAPRFKVTAGDVKVDHPDHAIGQIALMKAIGTTDGDFYSGLLNQIINAGSQGPKADEAGTNFMLAVIKGVEPRDQLEAMLAAQMAAVHMASMTFARRLAHVDNIPQQDAAERAFNKLTRTFAAQMAALKDYRSRGEQRMVVQHVHVAEGGQAIVGNVNGSPEGGGAREKTKEQPHALAYAPGVEMQREIEKERPAMPIASGSGSKNL